MQTHPTPGACTCSAPTDLPPGALYAGQVLDEAGNPQHHLILLPNRPDHKVYWQAAKAWAASVGGDLPSPQEQFLLLANCRDALPKTWCWTNKEDEGDASCAWSCYFYDGYQHDNHKSYEGSAVAVRRLALESFNPSGEPSAHVCTQTSKPSAETSKAITALRKRLHRWELDHLRAHCAELVDRLELALQRIDALESEVSRAWDCADSWRDQTQGLMTELEEAGKTIGLTQDGALVVMATEGAAA